MPDGRRLRACLQKMKIKRGQKIEGSRQKVREKDCVCPRKSQNAEVDHDVVEVVSISTGS